MAGVNVRSQAIYKALDKLSNQAERCEIRAKDFLERLGDEDFVARAELVRAAAFREAIEQLKEDLHL